MTPDVLKTNLDEIISNNNIEKMSDLLFEMSKFCKENHKYYLDFFDDEVISKQFKKSQKLLLKSMNELNKLKIIEPKFCKNGTGNKIGDIIEMTGHAYDTDYEFGLRIGYTYEVLEGAFKGQILQVISFDKYKYAIFNNNEYIQDSTIKRIS